MNFRGKRNGRVCLCDLRNRGTEFDSCPVNETFTLTISRRCGSLRFPCVREGVFRRMFAERNCLLSRPAEILGLCSAVGQRGRCYPLCVVYGAMSGMGPCISS